MAQIDTFFHKLIQLGGSDLHLSEGHVPKVRVHGGVRPIDDTILTGTFLLPLLKEICEERAWHKYQTEGDLDFAYEMDNDNRFRCNYLKQNKGAAAVFRIIPTKIKTLEDLGVPPSIKEFGHLRSGLVLVTGPTGSGKSTTLAALIDYINRNFNRHIITVEEPIEFVHTNKKSIITQREVPIQTPSFSDGLRAALREDADIVLVGEMRDLETISLALTAAETGLLVFGTLHTNNARKTVDRIIDVFPSEQQGQVRTMLSASLRGVVAQLLCKRCDSPGRIAVNEIMISTPAVGAIIREGATQKLYDVIIGGKSIGMQFMDDAIWDKLRQGIISPTEAFMKAIDKSRFKNFLPAEDAGLGAASGMSDHEASQLKSPPPPPHKPHPQAPTAHHRPNNKPSPISSTTKTHPTHPMSALDNAITTYTKFLTEKAGITHVDAPLLRSIARGLGPSLYNADSSLIAASDPTEIQRIRKNFLVKKLGIPDSETLDTTITQILTPIKSSPKKHRAAVYYLLVKHFQKEAIYQA